MAKISKVAYEFDPFRHTGVKASSLEDPKAALEEAALFVAEEVLDYIGDGVSPVKGGAWKKRLSKSYLKEKGKQSSATFANLELTGDMLDDLEVIVKGNKLSLQIEGKNADKADGNNRGTYGKKRGNKAKAREFIPKSGQTLRHDIIKGVREIFEDYLIEED